MGSSELIPNNSDDIERPNAMAPTRPTTAPTALRASPYNRNLLWTLGTLAERQSNADFPGPLRYDVRDRAIDPDNAEHQGHRTGNPEQHESERRARERAG